MSSPLIAAMLAFASVTILVWALKHLSTRFAKRYQETFTSSARTNLFDMFLFIEPRQLFVINMLTLLAVPFLVRLFFGSWVLGILLSIALALLPRFAYQFLHKRRRRKFVHQLPDALNMIASSMQSGANVSNAIEFMAEEMEAPIKQEFQLFLREQRLGVEFNTALDNMFKRIPEEEFQLVTAGMQISREVGGNLAEVLQRLSATLRRKIEMEGKIDALTSQGKMQGIVMTLLPVFIGVVLYHMEPSAMGRILTEPMGWALIALVIIMLTSGYLSIRKIVAIDV
ncbi:type II secretion system F family protein [Shewanella rhizosphaerae]|uniref:type II secretion system F family protein n=1 Tax=Shewanella TaxID=22 RepID=UPI001C65FFB6|nr:MULTISPECIES: type II secretion system F family protein [Shewanella]QYJ90646.1 type II secretion system F family protein [Shewanella halotolerans]QYK13560.1 type II secretion system F family protein [Shewanella rhizosphaerae]